MAPCGPAAPPDPCMLLSLALAWITHLTVASSSDTPLREASLCVLLQLLRVLVDIASGRPDV
jgi:hypothetical protein